MGAALRAKARAWLEQDPDPTTREELRSVIDASESGSAEADAALAAAFAGPLEFGTAGLRGEIGPGPSRMNAAVVTRAADVAPAVARLLARPLPAPVPA